MRIPVFLLIGWALIQPLPGQQDSTSNRNDDRASLGATYTDHPVGGPLDVGQTLESQRRERVPIFILEGVDRALEPYFDWKERLREEFGLGLGVDYQVLSQFATDALGEDDATGGALRLFGEWTLVGRDTERPGSIVFKVEHRHRISDVAPEAFGTELGYRGITGTAFGDFDHGMTDLYWKQQFWGDRPVELRLGRLAPTAFLDVTLTSDPLSTFLNLQHNFTPTLAYPADGSWGAAAWAAVTDKIYVAGTFLDANSDTTEMNFFEKSEFFTGLEVGWADRGARSSFLDNVHATFWHTDAREDAGVDESWGAGLTGSWLFGEDRWGPFIRLGWSEGGAALLAKSAAVGVAGNIGGERSDLIGCAISVGEGFGSRRTQSACEVFYRFQLARRLAITPDVQVLFNPIDNADDDVIGVFGLRARLTF